MPKIEITPSSNLSKTNILTLTQAQVDRYVKSCLHDACELVRDYARTHHRYEDNPARQAREGHIGLTRAIQFRVLSRKSAEYGYVGKVFINEKEAPYGKYQLYGTKRHGPKYAPALRFFSDRYGKWVRKLEVKGIKKDDFLGKALEANRLKIELIFLKKFYDMMRG